MPIFFYSARDEHGQLVRGTIDAISAQAARAALREKELDAEELHEATIDERKALEEGDFDFEKKHKTPNLVLGTSNKSTTPPPSSPSKKKKSKLKKSYYPFVDTLRLYAGWLLAWYCVVYILGSYQYVKDLPVEVPYVEALLPPFSDIVFSFTIASFLFLLLTTLHKTLGGGRMRAFSLTLLGLVVFSLYRLNV